MASGIDFNEDTDMNSYSMKTLMGIPAMNIIAKLSLQEKLWSEIGPEQDAYWTLNNGKELAMGD